MSGSVVQLQCTPHSLACQVPSSFCSHSSISISSAASQMGHLNLSGSLMSESFDMVFILLLYVSRQVMFIRHLRKLDGLRARHGHDHIAGADGVEAHLRARQALALRLYFHPELVAGPA